MRLARRALVIALTTFVLIAAASAQTLRPENDPRNQAPVVGNGVLPGGSTGLFTIYVGDTLRRSEFTLNVSYSNYDHDLGGADFSESLPTFNVVLNNYIDQLSARQSSRRVEADNAGEQVIAQHSPGLELGDSNPNATLVAENPSEDSVVVGGSRLPVREGLYPSLIKGKIGGSTESDKQHNQISSALEANRNLHYGGTEKGVSVRALNDCAEPATVNLSARAQAFVLNWRIVVPVMGMEGLR